MDWTPEEIKLIIPDYFEMLVKELNNEKYNKSEHRRKLIPLLQDRTDGSIEKKRQNISAILIELGLPYIKGYKPLPNFQRNKLRLPEFVAAYFKLHRNKLEKQFDHFVNKEVDLPKSPRVFEAIIEEAPVRSKFEEEEPEFKTIKKNYLQLEQNNRSLGERGEAFVIDYEKWRLNNLQKPHLADKILWVSKEEGDGAGYDILSKNVNGTDKYIEVKTTKLPKETPIFISKKEVQFARKMQNSFHLYRLFSFDTSPKMFTRPGPYETFCHLEPINFKGIF